MVSKECKNNCGRVIEWDNEKRFFVEVANGQRHMCPNYKAGAGKPYSGPATNSQAATLVEIETKLDSLIEKVDGFFSAWTAQNGYKKATEL